MARRPEKGPVDIFQMKGGGSKAKKDARRTSSRPRPAHQQQRENQGPSLDEVRKFEERRKAAAKAEVSATPQPSQQTTPKTSAKKEKVVEKVSTKSEENVERLAEMTRKSEALVAASAALDAEIKPEVEVETEIVPSPITPEVESVPVIVEDEVKAEEVVVEEPVVPVPVEPVQPRFQRKIPQAAKATGGPKRRRFHEKKGGGRQPQSRKLSRRKYLEYKYEVKDILDHPDINDEHRSNILGQVWAKGERIGVQAAIEFIDQKQEELVIPEDVANKLRKLVNSYTTKR